MKKLIKKGDVILFLFFLALIFIIAASSFLTSSQETSAASVEQVEIRISGELYGSYDLEKDQVITVTTEYGTNTITIENGRVAVTDSNCANQVCVYTGEIHMEGQMIICLPHLLSVEIVTSEENSSFDAISW